MANPFLTSEYRDIETAILLENAYVCDIDKAVAYTDGKRVFINTDDNLFNILPAYDHNMLKWLLWHEKMHMELRHHNRFFKYLHELNEKETMDEFQVTKAEVNIIMDILVHDSLSKMFPELIETAVNNLAQMRNRNSLTYTFKTHTLEEMLNEYAEYKKEAKSTKPPTGTGAGGSGIDKPTRDKDDRPLSPPPKDKKKEDEDKKEDTPHDKPHHDDKDARGHKPEGYKETNAPEHDKTDWSKLENIDPKEFIDTFDADKYVDKINKLKRKEVRLGRLTETLNGLVTTTRKRSYAMPSTIHVGNGVILKGSTPGRTKLYLCFDASGSMGGEMDIFKEIISKSIPQALLTPTAWFSGCNEKIKADPSGRSSYYFKGTFADFMPVYANCGWDDDGDRTIELCWKAEQEGYTPIGITDGGGRLSWSKKYLVQLQRTILVGPHNDLDWLQRVKKLNNKIQILDI